MNESLGNLVVALLKQEGQLSANAIRERLSVEQEAELLTTLRELVRSGTLKVSPRDNYYAPGHIKKRPRPRTVAVADGAAVDFGVATSTGTGFSVGGRVFVPGDVLTNQQLVDAFNVSNTHGIRISTRCSAVILVSSVHNQLYKDRWKDGAFDYTGEGRRGDQKMARGNLAISESASKGTPLLLFFKRGTNKYEFQGEVRLAAEPRTEEQPDDDGKMRRVWVFPLAPL